MRVVCAGYLVRYPVGGHTWHHLQYLLGLVQLGCDVYYVEEAGWPSSCYLPETHEWSNDPRYGLNYLSGLLGRAGLLGRDSFIDLQGGTYGASRADVADWCREADLYLSLSNMNAIPESRLCDRRAVVDTDPVFTQIRGHGLEDPADYDIRFTYGENVHKDSCDMPTAGLDWHPTRQPVVLDAWASTHGNDSDPLTSVMNWTAYGDRVYRGRLFGQKDREFESYVHLPQSTTWNMELAISAPDPVRHRLKENGWTVTDPRPISRSPSSYQDYIRKSAGEFGVAKHAYVSTNCGWFSDRTCGYLASGRPAVVQDTGFSRIIDVGEGLLTFHSTDEAVAQLAELRRDYERHARAARSLIVEWFDSDAVLSRLIENSI